MPGTSWHTRCPRHVASRQRPGPPKSARMACWHRKQVTPASCLSGFEKPGVLGEQFSSTQPGLPIVVFALIDSPFATCFSR